MGSQVIQYFFEVSLTKPDHKVYVDLTERLPLHPSDSFHRMWERLVIYLHAYKEGLALTKDIFEVREPLAVAKSITGTIHQWVERGSVERRKIERVQNHNPEAEISIYFDSEDEILKFCHELRGSKTNWIRHIRFYKFLASDFEAIGDPSERRHKLSATLLDPEFYIASDKGEMRVSVELFDMWERYQNSLGS